MKKLLILVLLLSGCATTTGSSVPGVPEIRCQATINGYDCVAIDYAKDGFSTKGEAYLFGKVIVRFVIPFVVDISKDIIMDYYKRKYNQPPQKQYEVVILEP